MGIVYSSVVDTPRAEVFAWHSRPGAFTRLSPPWQPLRLVSEADSLATGRAVLALPGGLRWVARHDGAAFDPPHRFVDELAAGGLASLPVRATLSWRHIHDFTEVTAGSTRVTDRVQTPVPEVLLRPTFAYRHRQLAGDLAEHRWAGERGVAPAVVAVSGASGLVGSALTAFLSTGGHRVIRLVRRAPRTLDERRWDPADPAPDLLAGVDAVVHLAGESIAGRFTEAHMRAIRDSRVGPTRALAELAGRTDGGPRTLVSASAVGYYGFDRGDDLLSEDSSRGEGFLADVVADWEAATDPAETAGIRVVRVRTGVVQSARGGTLALLRLLFAAGLGGRLGDGRQWLSWIGLDDLVGVYHRALFDESLHGPVNAVAPAAVRNADYTRTLARVLHRPAVLPVPGFGPRLILGERGARELAEADQRVVPTRLALAGYRFRHPDVESVLRHQLGRTNDPR
ncbi:TIGR01777 family oxidoreductase [Rhodococcus sp. NPDC127528]|uniref:TIGR01777 family oxidoreductase n=1 Tax=unclassified Rhodococcus (in: high G+C Gram-positive bacteria) TaxID=192944 RepID=UPI003640A2CB